MRVRRRRAHENPKEEELCQTPISEYEQSREDRIRENLEKMKKLGIVELSMGLKLNNTLLQPHRLAKNNKTPPSVSPWQPCSEPTRRSSRLKNVTPVTYSEVELLKKNKVALFDEEEFLVEESSRPEIYSEKHEKLLGSTEKSWTLFVDGYGRDGKRIYDQVKGKTCHQCRQKTLGYRTRCSECDKVQGQFCGDCLYMRYGEHVVEANENPEWICPVCRGICNCSLCRQAKGWAPTGPLYKKITRLGYKSVAHYLIQTRRAEVNPVTNDGANENSVKRSLAFSDVDVQPGSSAPLEDKSDDQDSSKQSLLLLAITPAFESIASQKEVSKIAFVEKQNLNLKQIVNKIAPSKEMNKQRETLKLQQTSPATIAMNSISIAKQAVKGIASLNKVTNDICGDGGTPSKTTPNLEQKLGLDDVPSSDSIGGRLRLRRKIYNAVEDGNEVSSLNGVKKMEEVIPSDIEHLGDDSNRKPTPLKTTPKLEQNLALVDVLSSDSIGGRLRRKRKVYNVMEAGNEVSSENGVKEEEVLPSDDEHLGNESNRKITPLKTTPKLEQKLDLVDVLSSDSIGGRQRLRRKVYNAEETGNKVSSENGVKTVEEVLPSDIEHLGNESSPKPTPKPSQRHNLIVEQSSDSIGGRLRQRRNLSDVKQVEQSVALEIEVEKQREELPSNVKTPKLSKKHALVIVPSSDSIGGRLRERRYTSNVNQAEQCVLPESVENQKEGKPSNVENLCVYKTALKLTSKLNQKHTLVLAPSSESIAGRLRQKRKISDVNLSLQDIRLDNEQEKQKEVPESDIKHRGDASYPVSLSPKLKQKLAISAVPSTDSIGGRLRQRRKTSDIERLHDTTIPLQTVPRLTQKLGLVAEPSSESIGGRLRLRRKVSDADQAVNAISSENNAPLKMTPKLNRKLALVALPSSDSIGGRLRQRRIESSNSRKAANEILEITQHLAKSIAGRSRAARKSI